MTSNLSLFLLRNDTQPPTNAVLNGGLADVVGLFPMVRILCDGPDPIMAKWLYDHDPNVIINVRNMAQLEDPYENMELTPANAVKYWAEIKWYRKALTDALRDKRRYVLTLWPNEPTVDGKTPEETRTIRAKLDAWWEALAELAAQDGWTITMGNFSAEARLSDKWRDFENMLEACLAGGHYLDLHGYSPTVMLADAYAEFLLPWRPLREALQRAGANDLLKIKIVAGELGEDRNLALGAGTSGYRLSMNNATYAERLAGKPNDPVSYGKSVLSALAADNVIAFLFWLAAQTYPDFIDYNCEIGLEVGNKHQDADPSVWTRLRPILAAQMGGGPIEIPPPQPEPPNPPVTPPVNPPVPDTPRKGVVIKTSDGLPNLRSIPSKSGVLLYKGYPAGRRVTLTGNEKAGYVEVYAPRVLDENDPQVIDTAWLLKSFVQIVST